MPKACLPGWGETLSADRLVVLAPLSPVAWAQRLGYLLDCVGHGLYLHLVSEVFQTLIDQAGELTVDELARLSRIVAEQRRPRRLCCR